VAKPNIGKNKVKITTKKHLIKEYWWVLKVEAK
jgi:hypothetical protein